MKSKVTGAETGCAFKNSKIGLWNFVPQPFYLLFILGLRDCCVFTGTLSFLPVQNVLEFVTTKGW